ncbi:MAG: S8 family serine peptidase, partial [Pseudomonadota bacterium]
MANLWLILVLFTSSYGFGEGFLAEIGPKGVWQAKRFASFKARGARYSDSSHLLSFQLKNVEDTGLAESYLRSYIDSSQLKYVISNGKVERSPIFSDPGAGGQWFHERIGTLKAWETTRGDASIVVAVLDTGMDYNHPSLKDALAINPGEIPGNGIDDDHNGLNDDYLGYDFVNEDPDPMDETSFYNPGQGTHLSGIIAAQAAAESGVFGIAPLTKILPIRILDRNGEGTLGSVVRGIDYAISRGAKIIVAGWSANLSKKGA